MSDTSPTHNVVSLDDYRKKVNARNRDPEEELEKIKAWLDYFFSNEDPIFNEDIDLGEFTFTIDTDLDLDE